MFTTSKQDLTQVSRKELILHAVLLLRTVNRYDSKDAQMEDFEKYISNDQLIDYIYHFHDPQPEWDCESLGESDYDDDHTLYSSCTAGDYGPSNPWDAPGMSVYDFI
jgi:hypothetical protein